MILYANGLLKYYVIALAIVCWVLTDSVVNGSIATKQNNTNEIISVTTAVRVNKCCERDEILIDNSCDLAKNESKYMCYTNTQCFFGMNGFFLLCGI